jgi:molybdenum cofactor cytidylyltransferase
MMTAIIILAAGSSSRMGQPKQNLIYGGKTLLNRMITCAKLASNSVILVLGAHSDQIEATISDSQIDIIYNNYWSLGMSSSIKMALSHTQLKYPDVESVLFVVCDQPFVSTEILKQLINTAKNSDKAIIACSYNNTIGVPALFEKKYFPAILSLKGQEGAKIIVEQHMDDVFSVSFSLGSIDIDTEEDFKRLVDKNN